MANQVTVPGSACTSGSADFRNSATSFSLPGLASSGTYSANFDIVSSCNVFDVMRTASGETASGCRDRRALILGSSETMVQAAAWHQTDPVNHSPCLTIFTDSFEER